MFNIFILTTYLNNYLLLAIFISYILDRIFWDIITTWYYIDILQGFIIYFEKKFVPYNFYKWIIVIELILINYKKCIEIILNYLNENNKKYINKVKHINIINYLLNNLLNMYNVYLRLQSYLIIKSNKINSGNNFNFKFILKNNINKADLSNPYKQLNLINLSYILNYTYVYILNILNNLSNMAYSHRLNTTVFFNKVNDLIKSFLFFKKFDDLNNKLIPISTLETNLVISLAIVETNIYTFHIFNLTIAHNLDVYINNELGDEDMIEASIEDISDWKECFDEYIEYKIIDITDPVILNVYLFSKLLNNRIDDKISYYCKNYELVIYDFFKIMVDIFLSGIYIYAYDLFHKNKINKKFVVNLYISSIKFIKNNLILLLNIKSIIMYTYINIYNLNFFSLTKYKDATLHYYTYSKMLLNTTLVKIKQIINNFILNVNEFLINFKKSFDSALLYAEIYYVNSKLPLKIIKNNCKLFLIKYLDYLEYCMLNHTFYYRRNIKKYYKKQYTPIKIKNELHEKLLLKLNLIAAYIKNFYINYLVFIKNINIKFFNYLFIIKYFKYNFSIYIETYIYFYIKELQLIYTNNIIYSFLIKLFYDLNSVLSALILIGYPNNVIRDIKKINSYILFIDIDYFKIKKYNYKLINYIDYSIINYNYVAKIFILFYQPLFIINYILSDISVSFSIILKKYKKLFTYLFNIYFNFIILSKLSFKKIKYLMFLILNTIYTKTIYITFLISYFFNRYFIDYIYLDLYLKYISIFKFKYKYYISLLEIFINWNFLIVIISLMGILLVLKWSRSVHRFFGYFFWTMIVFPIFIETHKILYIKLFLENYLNMDSIGFVVALKLDLLDIFNYKLYNFFYLISLLILLIFYFFVVKYGAFRHIYANFKATRWKYIKYPIIIYAVELLRLKLIEFICIFILYVSCKYSIYVNSYYLCLKFNQNYIISKLLSFIKKFIIEFEDPECYYLFYTIFVPNPYFLNLFIDLLLSFIALNWILTYCKEFKKADKKFVAFPLYVSEIFYKYIIIYYICYYLLVYLLIWISDGKLIWYGTQSLFVLFLYLDIRVHKIPKKTMAWYFRQIVELWPLTCSMLWTTPKYLYHDQQKYLSMRQKLRIPKKNFKILYNKAERWEKKIIFTFQRDKEIELYKFTAFCRLMSRKENMLREFNIFDYQGWQEDWTYCYKKINIFNWKLDWWDKPYIYLFKKLIYLTNMQICYFDHFPIIYRFSCKFTHFNGIHNIVKFFDYFYSNIYIFKFNNEYKYNHLMNLILRSKKYKSSCIDWKLDAHSKFDDKEELIHLKKLKIVLMEFSCGLRDKTPDWVFPSIYEKQYKKDGWKMFEDSRIDSVSLDWRPKIKKW